MATSLAQEMTLHFVLNPDDRRLFQRVYGEHLTEEKMQHTMNDLWSNLLEQLHLEDEGGIDTANHSPYNEEDQP